MEFKGSKGPWIMVEDNTVIASDGFSICTIDYPYRINPNWGNEGASHWSQKGFNVEAKDEESEANTKLIADAPAMLEMIKDFICWLDEGWDNGAIPRGGNSYIGMKNMIEKHTGSDKQSTRR